MNIYGYGKAELEMVYFPRVLFLIITFIFFSWNGTEFMVNEKMCLSSLMPLSLRSGFEKFRITLNHLRSLHDFISQTLDRRKDIGGIEDSRKPPFTYEGLYSYNDSSLVQNVFGPSK